MNDESKILVFYIGVASIRSVDIGEYIKKITEKITPTTFNGEIIVIPIQSHDTRIECINPKYITDEALILEHTLKLNELKDKIQEQINLIEK